ncbi:hypothetical protein LTR97_012147 [Elasticomyces elasticus]|uniref:Uncharacterized protein n=1 Tax=Elasticomyces elasticus TaxID=574655 RepID=A0AAN7ZQL0_9PEZI|nr:hypothetical protein LTR97_012147 [Elasticomyces elasticus]
MACSANCVETLISKSGGATCPDTPPPLLLSQHIYRAMTVAAMTSHPPKHRKAILKPMLHTALQPALSALAALMPLCVQQSPPSTHHRPHHGGDSDITSIYAHSSTIYTITGLLTSCNGSLDGLTAIANSADAKEEDFRRAQKYHTMPGEGSEE